MTAEVTLVKKRTKKKNTAKAIKENYQLNEDTTNLCIYCGAKKKDNVCNNCKTDDSNPTELINQQMRKEYNDIKELLETKTKQEELIEEPIKAELVKQDYGKAINHGYTNMLTIYKMLNDNEITTTKAIEAIKEKSLTDKLVAERLLSKAERYKPDPACITQLKDLINEIKNDCYNTIKEQTQSKEEEEENFSLEFKEKPDLETYKKLVSIYEMINRGFKTEAIDKIKKESQSELLIKELLLNKANEYHQDLNIFGEQEELIKSIREDDYNQIKKVLQKSIKNQDYNELTKLMKQAVEIEKPETTMNGIKDPVLKELIKKQYNEKIRNKMNEIIIYKAEEKLNELFEKEEFMEFINLKEAIDGKEFDNTMKTLGYKSDLELFKKEQREMNKAILLEGISNFVGSYIISGVFVYPISYVTAFIGDTFGIDELLNITSPYKNVPIIATIITTILSGLGAYTLKDTPITKDDKTAFREYKKLVKQYNRTY